MKKVLFIVLIGFFSLSVDAQVEKPKRNQCTLTGALDSNSAWELEFSYLKKFTSWFGAGAGLNIYHQYSDEISAQGAPLAGGSISQWILTDNSTRATGVQLNPCIHLNTPALYSFDGLELNLYAEPGLLMTLMADSKVEAAYWDGKGYNLIRKFKGSGNDWIYWNGRLGLALESEEGGFCLGYFASNTDMYAYKRNILIDKVRLGDNLLKKHFNWGIFIGFSHKF